MTYFLTTVNISPSVLFSLDMADKFLASNTTLTPAFLISPSKSQNSTQYHMTYMLQLFLLEAGDN